MKTLRMKATFRRMPHDRETDYDVSDQVRQWIERNLPDAQEDSLIVVEIRDS